jgi:hypothetical protein
VHAWGGPPGVQWIFPVVKAAAALRLLSVTRFPALATLTTAMLTLYFVVAVAADIRLVTDFSMPFPRRLSGAYAVMTAKGPSG